MSRTIEFTAIMVIDSSGNQLAKYLYDSFGNAIGMWGTLAAVNTYRFSSKEIDLRSGLYYYGYRNYEPNFQRFLNNDPIKEAGGINLYRFVANNPINLNDPLGLIDWNNFMINAWTAYGTVLGGAAGFIGGGGAGAIAGLGFGDAATIPAGAYVLASG